MKPHVAILVLACAACLVGLAVSALLLLREQRRAQAKAARMQAVTELHGPARAADFGGSRLDAGARGPSLRSGLATLWGYNAARRAIYPVGPLPALAAAAVVAAFAARVAAGFAGPAGWMALPAAWVMLCRGFFGWYEERHVKRLFLQFPDALAMIVRTVRVGLPVVEALRVVARDSPEPTCREFAELVEQTNIGVPIEDALRDMAQRNRLPEYRFFATALSLQGQTGGGLTETLENLADTIRKRVAARMRGHALAAEARMSSYILGALPIVAGSLLAAINPGYMSVLFTDPQGRMLLLFGLALLSLGAISMRTLIRRSLR